MRRLCRIIFLSLALIIAVSTLVLAGDGGRESQFSIGSGVRAVGMGGGFVGLADDASAIYWNQAALARLGNQEINLMHVTLFEGSVFDVASYVYPSSRWGGFGFSFMRLGTGDIVRRQNWTDLGEFSYSTWQLLLGYGRMLEGGFSIGSALKIVGQSMDNKSANGIGLDISFHKTLYRKISAGLNFQDIIAPRLRLGEESEIYPTTVIGGFGIREALLGAGFSHNLGLGLEKTDGRSLKLHIGMESICRRYLALRAGYDRDNLTFGFGVFYRRLRLDYAYKFMDGLTDSHRLGLSINIGMSVSEKSRQEKELESARGSSLILDERRRQFHFFKDLADEYYRNNSFDSAYIFYHRALAFNEDDQSSRTRISQIDETRKALYERARREKSEKDIIQPILDDYYTQAKTFTDKGSYGAALDLIKLALEVSPNDQKFVVLRDRTVEIREAEIRRLMGFASKAEKDGRYADAITLYDRILEISPDNAAVKQLIAKTSAELYNAQLISKAMELYTNGNLSEAKSRFEEALKEYPDNRVAREYIIKISAAMEEASELEDLQKDEMVWKTYLTALKHFRNGDYETAIKLWEEVLKGYPGNKNTIKNIEQARLRLQSRE